MSYILDALKKSELQRQNNMPDVTAHSDTESVSVKSDASDEYSQGLPSRWVLISFLVGVLAILFIYFSLPEVDTLENTDPLIDDVGIVEVKKVLVERSPQAAVTGAVIEVVDIFSADPLVTKEIPKLKITSHIYSSVSSKRSIVVNDQRFKEGDGISPGILINQITAKGMVISYRDKLLHVDRSRGWR